MNRVPRSLGHRWLGRGVAWRRFVRLGPCSGGVMRLSLATKISLALVGVLALAALSSVVAITSAYRLESLQETVVSENLASVQAAEELEIAMLEQRGYVSSYILDDGNRRWLEQLDGKRGAFDEWMARAHATARSDAEHEVLDRLERVQRDYARRREDVVELYDAGEEEQATALLLGEVAELYDQCYALCEEFLDMNQQLVAATSSDARRQVEQVTLIAMVTLTLTVLIGMALLWLFFHGVIFPLRRLAAEARLATDRPGTAAIDLDRDELRDLAHYMTLLMADVAETRSDLEHSRGRLAHAEKLAAVGKLAASVAHEIRNPLTSMRMWVYSLRRAVGEDEATGQKLDIVSGEIVRLERIVRNFLEFSRPPQLKLARHLIGTLLDKTLELIQHRLDEQRVRVVRRDEPRLPEVLCDEEQLRQVLLNLTNNALDAMRPGGELHVNLSASRRGGRRMVIVRLRDTGTGMSAEVQARIFEPFFTTKEGGTGLGLCIAASIMARHGGTLELNHSTPQGTEWGLWIPACD